MAGRRVDGRRFAEKSYRLFSFIRLIVHVGEKKRKQVAKQADLDKSIIKIQSMNMLGTAHTHARRLRRQDGVDLGSNILLVQTARM